MRSGGAPRSREQGVQDAIDRDVLEVALPLIAGLLIALCLVALTTGEFRRVVPASSYLVVCGVCWWLARNGRPGTAAGILSFGALVTCAVGVFFNGGMHAPALLALVACVALIGWIGGRRGATIGASGVTIVAAAAGVLQELDLLPSPPIPSPWVFATVAVTTAWINWAATARPQERLRSALRDAFAREEERLVAESKRAESDHAFAEVFEQSGQLMLLLEPDGSLVKANRAARAFIGEGQLRVGERLLETLAWPPAAKAQLTASLGALTSASPAQQLEPKDERGRTLDLTVSPFRDAQGALRWVIVQGRDMTELIAQKDREARSSRLALVGQLAGGVAHDFNNVLAVTLSSAETLEHELGVRGQLTDDDRENLAMLATATKRAADLTRRLLAFGRRAPMERRVRPLHELLESSVKLLQRTFPPNIELRTDLAAENDLVEFDAASLESVVLNLAINARDAMPEGGVLQVSTRQVELDEAACRDEVFELKPGPHLEVSVSDTGTGIAPEVLPRIFEPFFTTKAEGKGSGIGLSSVLGAMQEHHGAVRVESVLGRGSTFRLLFPLASQQHTDAAADSPAPSLQGLRALVVDDEPALRKLLGRLVTRLGVSAVIEGDAEAALAAFEREHGRFDLAILDVVLPGRSGQALAIDLLARAPRLKVLLVSGFPRDADFGALPKDRVAFLSKPFTQASLSGALAELCQSRG